MPLIVNTLMLAITRVNDLQKQENATGPTPALADAYHRLGLLQQQNKLYADAIKSFQREIDVRMAITGNQYPSLQDLIDVNYIAMLDANDAAGVAALVTNNSCGTVKQDGSQLACANNAKNEMEINWVFSLHAKLLALGKIDEALNILHYAVDICDANPGVSLQSCDYVYRRKQAIDLKLKVLYTRLATTPGYDPSFNDFYEVKTLVEKNYDGLDFVTQVIKLFTLYFRYSILCIRDFLFHGLIP